jgi:hypothetical protein
LKIFHDYRLTWGEFAVAQLNIHEVLDAMPDVFVSLEILNSSGTTTAAGMMH